MAELCAEFAFHAARLPANADSLEWLVGILASEAWMVGAVSGVAMECASPMLWPASDSDPRCGN